MADAEIRASLAALAGQTALLAEANFAARAAALDELELHLLGWPAELPPTTAAALRRQAETLQTQLEAVDQRLFQRLQADIRAGRLAPAELRALLTAYAGPPDPDPEATRYDHLDALTNGLFPVPAQPLQPQFSDPEMVYYQKTPARIISRLAARLAPADVLYDLGSGLGQVPLLVHLLSGATTHGIEIEPGYCQYAQACAEVLDLPHVRFHCLDVRRADLADATAFYLFTPFTGSIMREVLVQLRKLARHRALKLFSYGPSTEALQEQPWLRRVGEEGHLYQLAEFRSAA
ncbi:hypothetical protein LJ737_13425 [Hymenobacter sp. 15J16-1T3B]|uniref:class I SAM-dependent methyltransferase n=1 Tax=Hymenobacter sp. 15J16-1T3B TaxID=2886941 RepID=UPI001D100857|nr:class I SAM-dependent methyltransferase [Hymenobacter sp. 15J16-1T3B]MCC3158243.1 hypothetical protein [Hymenobacter sp. 15J16-1T3B]